jgi:hypothetical protein
LHRIVRVDAALEHLNGERDDVAVRLSLVSDKDDPDLAQIEGLRRKLKSLNLKIAHHLLDQQ